MEKGLWGNNVVTDTKPYIKEVITVKRRVLILALAALLLMPASALAAPGDERVAVGADLTKSQKETVYGYFGISQGSVEELIVTIDDERAELEGVVPADKMGTRSISSVYIRELEPGSGITVDTHNITWVTADMYKSALTTAGVADAAVVVAAPTGVSGTAALTGIFRCYESVTGKPLDEQAKDVAGEELVFTGELAELLGSEEAVAFMKELKEALARSKDMTDDELRQLIRDTAKDANITLTEESVERLLGLIRRLAQMDLDPEAILEQVRWYERMIRGFRQAGEKAGELVTAFNRFFDRAVEWFRNLFSRS
jgi:uncharacterized protein YpuA (DUF1002 family)